MRQKRMALINDITGFGRCSIAVMAPIISTMRIQAVPVPTAILSTHTQFPVYHFDDYTKHMPEYIQTYKDLKLEFDGIATGFLGSKEQVEIVIDFIQSFKRKETFVLVDPVMGDHGHLYATYSKEMAESMKNLVHYADILTPNLTELVTLLDRNYPEVIPSKEELGQMCHELSLKGPQMIVVTGIPIDASHIMNFIYDHGKTSSIIVHRIGPDRSGTGDVVSSVIAGGYLNNHSFYECVKKATEFSSQCIAYSEEIGTPTYYGLCFEQYLSELGDF